MTTENNEEKKNECLDKETCNHCQKRMKKKRTNFIVEMILPKKYIMRECGIAEHWNHINHMTYSRIKMMVENKQQKEEEEKKTASIILFFSFLRRTQWLSAV